jgi:NADH dehydrogenase
MWVFEGINKIGEGWFAWSTGSKSGWMFSPGVTQAGVDAVAADALTAASDTGVVEGLSTVQDDLFSAADDLFGSAEDLFGGAEDLFGGGDDLFGAAASTAADAVSAASGTVTETAVGAFHAVWDLTQPIFSSTGVVATWFRETFMDGIMAYIPFQGFQLGVVLAEIAIGLMLVGGLFTWWAAAVSIVMCLVFTLSGMFAWNQVWFLFAGFLFLGGGGRAFGLDCWVVPFCKKWWNGTKFARRLYWYHDGPSK